MKQEMLNRKEAGRQGDGEAGRRGDRESGDGRGKWREEGKGEREGQEEEERQEGGVVLTGSMVKHALSQSRLQPDLRSWW